MIPDWEISAYPGEILGDGRKGQQPPQNKGPQKDTPGRYQPKLNKEKIETL